MYCGSNSAFFDSQGNAVSQLVLTGKLLNKGLAWIPARQLAGRLLKMRSFDSDIVANEFN
jgi:hypothetical protein